MNNFRDKFRNVQYKMLTEILRGHSRQELDC